MTPPPDELRSLRWNPDVGAVEVIDQTRLPAELCWLRLDTLDACCEAIRDMRVRGAPLIGVTAAFGLACALRQDGSDAQLARALAALLATRPTAVNLRWALQRSADRLRECAPAQRSDSALALALELCEQEIGCCARIGEAGLGLLRQCAGRDVLQVMTHCNAGWLATVAWGTALAPVYRAHAEGLRVHVWVSETRPRNQGAALTAWELQRAGVPCTVVADNACGALLRTGQVDCVIVGSDRTAANGDVCNKVGTYLKALAARASGVPFYVALPTSTIDWDCPTGEAIPIEERDPAEVLTATGADARGRACRVTLAAPGSRAWNPGFDVTPAALVSALVTEYGVSAATPVALAALRERLSAAAAG